MSGLRASGVAALVASDLDGYLSEEIPVIPHPRRLASIPRPRARFSKSGSESEEEAEPRLSNRI